MASGTTVVLPSTDPSHASLRGALLNSAFPVLALTPVAGPPEALSARLCQAINAARPAPPLVVVAFGSAAAFLPAVGLSQRAAHRPVAEYVLVDAAVPAVTDSWPDARVSVYATDLAADATAHARLRGWDVHPVAELPDWRPGR